MQTKPRRVAKMIVGVALFAGLVFHPGALLAQDHELGTCLRIADVVERVSCYDAIARARQGEPQTSDAEGSPPASKPLASGQTAPPAPHTEFGLSPAQRESRLPAQEQQLNEITAVVSSAQQVGAGYWQFVMRDGAVWRLMENRTRFRAPRPGDEVMIRRGSLGSYQLDADGQPAIRIKRIN